MSARCALAATLACMLFACATDKGVVGYPAPLACSDDAPCDKGLYCNAAAACVPCTTATCGEQDSGSLQDASAPHEPPKCSQDASCTECQTNADCSDPFPFCMDDRCAMCLEDDDCEDAQCEDGTCVPEDETETEDESGDNSGPGSSGDP